MEKLKFSATINAPKEKVWNSLWEDASYREWTTPFCEGSYAETDNWKEGSKVLFLGPGRSGMVSKVRENRENEFMSFEHLGEVKEGVEDTTSDAVQIWAGALESYTLRENNGSTELEVDIDIAESHKDYMVKAWPKALEVLKNLAEKK